MTVAGTMRARRLAPAVAAAVAAADADVWRSELLAQLDAVWSRAAVNVPRYRDLVAAGDVPARLTTLEAFTAVPPVTRAELAADVDRHRDRTTPTGAVRTTGGSTGEPLRLPAWRGEFPGGTADLWAARAPYGVVPASRLLLVWGHAHLLGSGARGRVAALRRAVADRLLGYHRFSAYDLGPARLRAVGDVVLRHRPDAVVGYAGALDALARANEDRAAAFARLGLRVVVATAEALPRPDSSEVIERVLSAPLALEYGAAETGIIAHSAPGQRDVLHVRGARHLVEILPDGARDGTGEVVVTSLFRRAVPLLRYRTGDRADLPAEPEVGVAVLRGLRGRASGLVALDDLTAVHSEVFAHAVRSEPVVLRYQVVRGSPLTLRLLTATDDPALVRRVAHRLAVANPALAGARVTTVRTLAMTAAGKTPLVIDPGPTSAG